MKALKRLVWWLRMQRFSAGERILHALATRGSALTLQTMADDYGLRVQDYGLGLRWIHETLDLMEEAGLIRLDSAGAQARYVLTAKGRRLACDSQKRQPERWQRLCELRGRP